jgi:hypothetical protein
MKNMNRKESKKITVMATIIVGFMVIAFMPLASAGVSNFTVTPGTGLAGAVDSYNVLVTTDGVTSINITIPAGFIAVAPTTGGVEIARVDFWNTSKGDYYGYATITSSSDYEHEVDVYSEMQVGGDTFEYGPTPQYVDYTPGGVTPFDVKVNDGTAWANITLPTETEDGRIRITIDCESLDLLQDVHIAIKQFVRNPLTACDYEFIADGVTEKVSITAPIGRGAVFRDGLWFVDTNGDHIADQVFGYGQAGDVPLVWDVGGDNGIAIFREGMWCVDTTGDHVSDLIFGYGLPDDVPIVGDFNRDGIGDIGVFRKGMWCIDTTGDHIADLVFYYGLPNDVDVPLVGDFNHNGTDDIAIFRNGIWCVDTTGNHVANIVVGYGLATDVPLIGDFECNGIDNIAVFRNGIWCVDTTGTCVADQIYGYGIAGDVPLVGDI